MTAPVNDLLSQIAKHFDTAQDAINSLVRVQIGQGLAAMFLERIRPFEEDERLKAVKGEDIWPDFVMTYFQRMRSAKAITIRVAE